MAVPVPQGVPVPNNVLVIPPADPNWVWGNALGADYSLDTQAGPGQVLVIPAQGGGEKERAVSAFAGNDCIGFRGCDGFGKPSIIGPGLIDCAVRKAQIDFGEATWWGINLDINQQEGINSVTDPQQLQTYLQASYGPRPSVWPLDQIVTTYQTVADPCADSIVAHTNPCPAGTFWNNALERCEYPTLAWIVIPPPQPGPIATKPLCTCPPGAYCAHRTVCPTTAPCDCPDPPLPINVGSNPPLDVTNVEGGFPLTAVHSGIQRQTAVRSHASNLVSTPHSREATVPMIPSMIPHPDCGCDRGEADDSETEDVLEG